MSAARDMSPDIFFQRKRNSSRVYQMLKPAELIVYWPVAGSKLALPGITGLPISDWPVKMPIGVSKFLLGRWKSGGGATWVCVADPGWAHSGAAGFGGVDVVGVCAWI